MPAEPVTDPEMPVMTVPVHCPKCGRDRMTGPRVAWRALADGTTEWVGWCARCCTRYPHTNVFDDPPELTVLEGGKA